MRGHILGSFDVISQDGAIRRLDFIACVCRRSQDDEVKLRIKRVRSRESLSIVRMDWHRAYSVLFGAEGLYRGCFRRLRL